MAREAGVDDDVLEVGIAKRIEARDDEELLFAIDVFHDGSQFSRQSGREREC